MASRYQYRCDVCNSVVPAERVEKRVPGTNGMTRDMPTLICEKDNVPMTRESYQPKRREVRD